MSDALKKLEFVDRAKNMVARQGVNQSTPTQIEEDYSPMHSGSVRKVEMKTSSVVTLTQVVDCLRRQEIEYSEYLRDATQGNSITAIIRGSSMSEKKARCSIVFKFDDHDCLVAYDVQGASEPLEADGTAASGGAGLNPNPFSNNPACPV